MFRQPDIWTTHVDTFDGNPCEPKAIKNILSLGSPTVRWRREHLHTIADPFLVTANGRLWLFVEEARFALNGCIAAMSTADLIHWESHGIVLRESTHLSYPQVFIHGGINWMLPEATKSGAVWIYKCDQLPGPWRRAHRLLEEPHADPTLLEQDERWYIWATDAKNKLRLYHSSDLTGPYIEHPASPLTADPRFSRCGGSPLRLRDGSLLRLAQDCSSTYGRGLHAMRISIISSLEYRETLFRADFLPRDERWNANGTHHLSVVEFNGVQVRAVDGLQPDYTINQLARAFWWLFRAVETLFARRT